MSGLRRAAGAILAVALVAMSQSACTAFADEAAVARGATIAGLGGCMNCHTAKGGQPLAGGDPLVTPVGTFVAPNITPDPDAGIGGWSLEQFTRAMREGIDDEGAPLYPAFPFPWFRHMSDQDIGDVWAWLQAQPAVATPVPDHSLSFPYSIRTGLWAWRLVFLADAPLVPDPAKSEAWNRGRVLVEGAGHCGACHTPRTFGGYGAPDPAHPLAGNVKGSIVGAVPSIAPDEKGIGEWSVSDIADFLDSGMTPDGDFAGGEMAKVIENGTSKLEPADREAIATYLKEGSSPP